MYKLFIYPNLTEERYISKVKKAIHILKEKGYECLLNKEDNLRLFNNADYIGEASDCDLIVTLGGDGTFLRGSKLALSLDKPICGINCGDLGYLCTYQLKNIDKVDFESLKISKSSTIEFEYNNETYYALNEVVIGKDYFGGTIHLKYSIDDEEYIFKGDGLIICTSTGSTGYNKSAGGSIFKDDDKMEVTPICPNGDIVKPMIVDNEAVINVELINPKYTASIYVDGNLLGPLNKIAIKDSKRSVKILR